MEQNTVRDLNATKMLYFLTFHLDSGSSSLSNSNSSIPYIQVFQSTLYAEGHVDLITINR